MFDNFLLQFETVLHYIAKFSIHSLELVGILIIIVGSAKTFYLTVKRIKKKEKTPERSRMRSLMTAMS